MYSIVNNIIFSIGENPYIVFFTINIILFIIGMFLDAGPTILIFAPILAPPLMSLGIDPLHIGIVMGINLIIGLVTPPMGLVLFMASDISKVSLEQIVAEGWPFILVEIAVLFLITFVPDLVLFMPRVLLGYAG